jgi:hypothetical protein
MGAWTPYSGAAVITSTTASWQAVDLSGIVGTRTAVVVLGVTGIATRALAIRENGGDERTAGVAVAGGRGMSAGGATGAGAFMLLGRTDGSGVLQYKDSAGVGWTSDVFLLGYFVPDYDGLAGVESSPSMPNMWLPAVAVPTAFRPPAGRQGLIGLGYQSDVASQQVATYPDATGDQLEAFGGQNGASGYRGWNTAAMTYVTYTMLTEIDDDGIYHRIAASTHTVNQVTARWAESSYYVPSRQSLWTAYALPAYTTSWTTVDLSPYCGSASVLAVLRIKVNTGGGVPTAAARPYGASEDYIETGGAIYGSSIGQVVASAGDGAIIVCPTDAQGRLQLASAVAAQTWDLDLLGFVGPYLWTPPVVDVASVTPTGTIVSLTAPQTIGLRVTDPSGSGLDMSTMDLVATDQLGGTVPLLTAGALASGITGYVTETGSGINGSPTEVEVRLDWPAALRSGQRYDASLDVTSEIGIAL